MSLRAWSSRLDPAPLVMRTGHIEPRAQANGRDHIPQETRAQRIGLGLIRVGAVPDSRVKDSRKRLKFCNIHTQGISYTKEILQKG